MTGFFWSCFYKAEAVCLISARQPRARPDLLSAEGLKAATVLGDHVTERRGSRTEANPPSAAAFRLLTLQHHIPSLEGRGRTWMSHGGRGMGSGRGMDGSRVSQGQRQSGELGWMQPNEFFHSAAAPDRRHHLGILSIQTSPSPSPAAPNQPLLFSFFILFTSIFILLLREI